MSKFFVFRILTMYFSLFGIGIILLIFNFPIYIVVPIIVLLCYYYPNTETLFHWINKDIRGDDK